MTRSVCRRHSRLNVSLSIPNCRPQFPGPAPSSPLGPACPSPASLSTTRIPRTRTPSCRPLSRADPRMYDFPVGSPPHPPRASCRHSAKVCKCDDVIIWSLVRRREYTIDTYTLNRMSPLSMCIRMLTRSTELSWRWRVSYPSKRHRLDISPEPANSARFKSTNPSFCKWRGAFDRSVGRACERGQCHLHDNSGRPSAPSATICATCTGPRCPSICWRTSCRETQRTVPT